jgi:NADPH-dependent ferric siderophore reductase
MSAEFPFVLARAIVDGVERVSPTFVRVTFAGDELSDLGTPGRVFDQRIKLIFPASGHPLPSLSGAGNDWYTRWVALPERSRGSMRTYSMRDLVVINDETRVVVDFVLHLDPGATGPASRWARDATVGDEVLILGPRRDHTDAGGIEFSPGNARSVLLAGDETAAPAIARILEDVDSAVRGAAFIEVPEVGDILPIDAPAGVTVTWLPRSGGAHGESLIPTVLDYVGSPAALTVTDVDSEELLWETPNYSGLGEELDQQHEATVERYFWIAGESAVVTTLRRHLVSELHINRSDVAFMGYWRSGVAMRT